MALAAGVPVVVVTGEHAQAAAESPHRRRSAKYERTTWDYDSICTLTLSQQQQAHHQANTTLIKERVRRLLVLEEEDDDGRASASASSRLRTIHQLQSLGIAYHFEEEIRAVLLSIHHHHAAAAGLDPHSAALLFRMLRQQGIPASTDLLVMGCSAALREDDETDRLLLALYEASYLAFPGETVLEEARAFAVQSLAAGDLQQQQLLPLHWRAPRLQAMWSLRQQKDDTTTDPAILHLARLDFDRVQALHRRELAEVTRWWKQSGLQGQLPSFARDRVVECFFCAACIAPEPHPADCREVLAKAGALIVHLDDIFDVYGTPDELQAFTDAIAAWDADAAAVGALPEYMKAVYAAICETSTTAADQVLRNHGCDVLPLYKKAWHDLCTAFLVEARWHQQSHRPSFREYLANGWVTSTGPLLLLHAATAGGGAGAPINGRLVELSSTIFRLCNDCASHQAESERGDAPSAIACCMAEPWCAPARTKPAPPSRASSPTPGRSSTRRYHHPRLRMIRATCCASTLPGSSTASTRTEMASPHRMKRMVQDLLFNPITYSS